MLTRRQFLRSSVAVAATAAVLPAAVGAEPSHIGIDWGSPSDAHWISTIWNAPNGRRYLAQARRGGCDITVTELTTQIRELT